MFPPFPDGPFKYYYDASRGLRFEPEAIRKYIREGKTECDVVSLNDSLIVALSRTNFGDNLALDTQLTTNSTFDGNFEDVYIHLCS